MSKIVAGKYNGTGAALYVALGFVPDRVEVRALEDADEGHYVWTKQMMQSADMVQGMSYVGSSGATQQAALTSAGIEPHFGGTDITSTNQTSTTYGEGVFLEIDTNDYRYLPANAPGGSSLGDASTADIDTWTLTTSGSQTGKFNSDVVGTYIGEGSVIIIAGKEYSVLALTAGQGSADDEVTLNQDAPSGPIEYIGGKNTTKPVAVGNVSKAGFKLNATTVVNVNDELCSFYAVQY